MANLQHWHMIDCARQVECSCRSSLYSMALHWHAPADGRGGNAQLRVAAGSAFLRVLVWQLPAVSFASLWQAAGRTAGALFLRSRSVHRGCCNKEMHEFVRMAVHGIYAATPTLRRFPARQLVRSCTADWLHSDT